MAAGVLAWVSDISVQLSANLSLTVGSQAITRLNRPYGVHLRNFWLPRKQQRHVEDLVPRG